MANYIVTLNLRNLDVLFNRMTWVLAKAEVCGANVTGMADGPDLDTTERYPGWGQVTRKRRIEERSSRRHAIDLPVYGWKVFLLIEAASNIPVVVKVGQIQEHESHWTRALVT